MQGETLFHCHRDNDAEVLRRETVRFSKSGSGGRLLLGKKRDLLWSITKKPGSYLNIRVMWGSGMKWWCQGYETEETNRNPRQDLATN